MRRFLMLAAFAAVAAAMYVAAASGSQQSRGPTAKQFKALKTQVATLSKKLKTTQNDLSALALAYVHCSLPSEIGLAEKPSGGGSGWGYDFTFGDGTPGFAAALDLAATAPAAPVQWEITPFNYLDSGCQSLVGASAIRHHAVRLITQKFAQSH
jgi:hypothetical protein